MHRSEKKPVPVISRKRSLDYKKLEIEDASRSLSNSSTAFNNFSDCDPDDDDELRFILLGGRDHRTLTLDQFLHKIHPQFQELDQLLNDYRINDNTKKLLLGQLVFYCVCSPNPLKALKDTLRSYRFILGITKMIDCVSFALKLNRQDTITLMKQLLPEHNF